MFKHLDKTAKMVQRKAATDWKAYSPVLAAELKARQNAANLAAAFATMVAGLSTMATNHKTFADLRRLKTSMQAHGMTRQVAELAVVKLPGVESFDRVPVGVRDPRFTAALEAVDTALKSENQAASDWVKSCSDNVDAYLDAAKSDMEALGQSISHCLEGLESCDMDESALANCQVTAICFDGAMSCFESLLDILPDLDCKVSDPTDADGVVAHQDKMSDMVEALGPHTGLTVSDDNVHQLALDDVPDVMQPKTDSLLNLGYTAENCVELLKRADNVVDEVLGLIGRKEQLCSNLASAADMCQNCDNDVPPAIADEGGDPEPEPTPDPADPEPEPDAPEPDEEPATEALTQTDLITHHVSSHLCCIASAVHCCGKTVNGVLTVAQRMCDGEDMPSAVPPAPNGE